MIQKELLDLLITWGNSKRFLPSVTFFSKGNLLTFSAIVECFYCVAWQLDNDNIIDQLSLGFLAQLVEHCTGIAEIMGSNPVQAWMFFRPPFHYYLSSVHYCEDRFHIHDIISAKRKPPQSLVFYFRKENNTNQKKMSQNSIHFRLCH